MNRLEQENMADVLRERYLAVCDRIGEATRRAGRKEQDIALVAVSKFHPAEAIRAVAACGQRLFGENYVQEAKAKQEQLRELDLQWHFIGHAQTNKARDLAGKFALIHTVDSMHLATALAKRLPPAGIGIQHILIQVNIGDEPQKSGVAINDLPSLAEKLLSLPQLELDGLMCLPPNFGDGEAARPYFARLRELRDRLEATTGKKLPCLSMGMSGDFAEAIDEGATLVRIGTDIFGPRPIRQPGDPNRS